MPTSGSFRSLAPGPGAPPAGATVPFTLNGHTLQAVAGCNVAAALLANGVSAFRTAAVSGEPRGPYCMMGVCFDCLVEIDGVPNCQSCLTTVRPGMQVRTQSGLRPVAAQEAGHGQ